MEGIQEFLESSTIHGLAHISATRNKLNQLFWILIVILGFLAAGFLIKNAFLDWEKSPIETSIETFPISDVYFPTIVVCPPKVAFRLILIPKYFSVIMEIFGNHNILPRVIFINRTHTLFICRFMCRYTVHNLYRSTVLLCTQLI